MPGKPFIFICGPDDFLVNRLGRQRYDELAAHAADEFSHEIINGMAANGDEVEAAVNALRQAVQTISLFGGRRVVWLKDVSFLADTVTGRAEGTLRQVEELQAILGGLDPEQVAVVVTAAPIDRRRSFLKWCEANADFALVGDEGKESGGALGEAVRAEAEAVGVAFTPDALSLLLAKVGPNTRLLFEEVHKLAAFAGPAEPPKPGEAPVVIEESHVDEMTPNFAEGDFFEVAEAFCSGDLKWMLAALQRHFFGGGDARPVLTALQNRNRLLVQIRVLLDSGELRLGLRGLDKAGFDRAATAYRRHFGAAASERSAYNLFTQNLWYLGKLAGAAKLPPLRRLIDNQQEFVAAFEEIVRRPDEQQEVLREMAVRCLT